MKSRWMNVWRKGALLAVAAVAAVNVLSIAQKISPPPVDPPISMDDPLVRYERRFRGVRESVQARGIRGTVGYFGERANGDDDYFYAQFALVPLVLDIDPSPYEWAVANLPTSSPETRFPANWMVVKNFGEGVLLLRKSSP